MRQTAPQKAVKPTSTATAAGTSTSDCQGSSAATAGPERLPAGDAMRLDRGHRHPGRVVDAYARAEPPPPSAAPAGWPRRAEGRAGDERQPHQEQHQSAEHVQLGVQVDDRVARVATSVEPLRSRAETPGPGLAACRRLRPRTPLPRRVSAARPHPRPSARVSRAAARTRRTSRGPDPHDQERVDRRRLFCLRGRESARAERGDAMHPFLIMGAGIAMFAAFWVLLAETLVRSVCLGRAAATLGVARCAALAVGTLQGPSRGIPARERRRLKQRWRGARAT